MSKVFCNTCVLHSNIPGVAVDETGQCSVCNEHASLETINQRTIKYFTNKLEKECNEVKRKKKRENALVLFSGGKDSTFLMNLLIEKYGLDPIAFSVVHPLVNEVASKNMDEAVKKMGIPLIKYYIKKEDYIKIMKHSLTKGYLKCKDECLGCNTCSYIFKNAALVTAIRNGIPLVFDGTDKAQNETPIFIHGEKMKAEAGKGRYPFDPLHGIVMDALGDEYNGSLYDFKYDNLKSFEFPSFISPLTFLDYSFQKDFKKFSYLGLESNQYKTVFTNCSAVPFFSFFSLQRYDCLTYIRHYANEIRKQSPYFTQSKLQYEKDEKALSRETIQNLLNEYENAIYFAYENKLMPDTVTDEIKQRIFSMSPEHFKIYGKEVCDIFLEQILQVNKYAQFFDIDLSTIKRESSDIVNK